MNKTAIKNFAIWARNKLIADIQYRAGLMGITAEGIKAALPQSTAAMEFYDIGTPEPYSIAGDAIRQRKRMVEIIRQAALLHDVGKIGIPEYILNKAEPGPCLLHVVKS